MLSGGRFNIMASILGAYVIQFLTTTLYKFNVSSDALPAYKAVVVIVLVVISAPAVKEKLSGLGKRLTKQRGSLDMVKMKMRAAGRSLAGPTV